MAANSNRTIPNNIVPDVTSDGLCRCRNMNGRRRHDRRFARNSPRTRIIVLTTYHGRCPGAAGAQGRRARLLTQGFSCGKNFWRPSDWFHAGQKRRMPPEVATELAEHATDDAFVLTGNRSSSGRFRVEEMPIKRSPPNSPSRKRP